MIPLAFPGEFAGASLKQPKPRQSRGGVPHVPRRIRRGLIEALRHEGRRPRRTGPFPGEFAGASLKPLIRYGFPTVPTTVPRRIRRGLIEAWSASAGTEGALPRSPANSPGPH